MQQFILQCFVTCQFGSRKGIHPAAKDSQQFLKIRLCLPLEKFVSEMKMEIISSTVWHHIVIILSMVWKQKAGRMLYTLHWLMSGEHCEHSFSINEVDPHRARLPH